MEGIPFIFSGFGSAFSFKKISPNKYSSTFCPLTQGMNFERLCYFNIAYDTANLSESIYARFMKIG